MLKKLIWNILIYWKIHKTNQTKTKQKNTWKVVTSLKNLNRNQNQKQWIDIYRIHDPMEMCVGWIKREMYSCKLKKYIQIFVCLHWNEKWKLKFVYFLIVFNQYIGKYIETGEFPPPPSSWRDINSDSQN